MADKIKFTEELDASYQFQGAAITLGAGMIDGVCETNHLVKIPIKTLNRHGLIAGATGTGKTKSLQLLAEGLSANGIPTLLKDIKGDLSGIAKPGAMYPKIEERIKKIVTMWSPSTFPVELLSLSDQPGIKLRATTSEFGPVLLSKILDLNETQQGILAMIFKYCDDKKLPLLDLEDLKKVIQYITGDGKNEIEKNYGAISTVSAGTILRKVIELEQQGAAGFFGEPSFDPNDLLRTDNGVTSGGGVTSSQKYTKPSINSTSVSISTGTTFPFTHRMFNLVAITPTILSSSFCQYIGVSSALFTTSFDNTIDNTVGVNIQLTFAGDFLTVYSITSYLVPTKVF